jgi:hypothetical protein
MKKDETKELKQKAKDNATAMLAKLKNLEIEYKNLLDEERSKFNQNSEKIQIN